MNSHFGVVRKEEKSSQNGDVYGRRLKKALFLGCAACSTTNGAFWGGNNNVLGPFTGALAKDRINFAEKKGTEQSSTRLDNLASRAVDGNKSHDFDDNSCTHTKGKQFGPPWWMVDLGTRVTVTDGLVYNRICSGDCGKRLEGAQVVVTDTQAPANENTYDFLYTQSKRQCNLQYLKDRHENPFSCHGGVVGRYVYVYFPDIDTMENHQHVLTLCEVEVFGYLEDNLALGKPTGQSSTRENSGSEWELGQPDGGASDRAVDGIANGSFSQHSCTHTKGSDRAWWYVDLEDRYTVTEGVVFNRIDMTCQSELDGDCGARLDGMQVVVTESKIPEDSLGSEFATYEFLRNYNSKEFCKVHKKDGEEFAEESDVIGFTCPTLGVVGRYVYVFFPDIISDKNQVLTLCEVKVFGSPAPFECMNSAGEAVPVAPNDIEAWSEAWSECTQYGDCAYPGTRTTLPFQQQPTENQCGYCSASNILSNKDDHEMMLKNDEKVSNKDDCLATYGESFTSVWTAGPVYSPEFFHHYSSMVGCMNLSVKVEADCTAPGYKWYVNNSMLLDSGDVGCIKVGTKENTCGIVHGGARPEFEYRSGECKNTAIEREVDCTEPGFNWYVNVEQPVCARADSTESTCGYHYSEGGCMNWATVEADCTDPGYAWYSDVVDSGSVGCIKVGATENTCGIYLGDDNYAYDYRKYDYRRGECKNTDIERAADCTEPDFNWYSFGHPGCVNVASTESTCGDLISGTCSDPAYHDNEDLCTSPKPSWTAYTWVENRWSYDATVDGTQRGDDHESFTSSSSNLGAGLAVAYSFTALVWLCS